MEKNHLENIYPNMGITVSHQISSLKIYFRSGHEKWIIGGPTLSNLQVCIGANEEIIGP